MTASEQSSAVLLVAHGTADSVEDIPEFLRNVTGGRGVPPQVIEEVKHRYSLIGHSPMNEITARQGELLARELGLPIRFVGTGEQINDMVPFDAETYANSLFD